MYTGYVISPKNIGTGTQCTKGETIAVGVLPERKSHALYVESCGRLRVLAYFKTEEQDKEAGRMLDRLAAAQPNGKD